MRRVVGPRVTDRIQKSISGYSLWEVEQKGKFRGHIILEALSIVKKYLPEAAIIGIWRVTSEDLRAYLE